MARGLQPVDMEAVMNTKQRVAVVGVDLGTTGDEAMLNGLRLVASGALDKLHLLHIVDPKRILDDPEQRAMATEAAALEGAPRSMVARAQLLGRAYELNVPSSAVIGHARLGEPAATLLQMCVDYDADLLIVGTHGRRGFDRFLEGSIAEQVVRAARCPVLVARPKDYTHAEKTVLPDAPYAPGEEPVRQPPNEPHTQVSTTLDSWAPSDNGPTGFRIV